MVWAAEQNSDVCAKNHAVMGSLLSKHQHSVHTAYSNSLSIRGNTPSTPMCMYDLGPNTTEKQPRKGHCQERDMLYF